MSGIDWNSAPADATHWEPEGIANPGWMKYESGKWFYWPKTHVGVELNRGWLSCYPGIDRIVTFVKRPASVVAKAWNGEGLPPVGTDCQMTHEAWGNRGWEQVKILYISTEYAITTDGHNEQHWHMRNVKFRPIRTPEQLAAERRAETIKRAAELCGFPRGDYAFSVLEALYDNGLLKWSDDQ